MCSQALEWIHDTGEFYLSTHTSTGSSIHHTQELLKEHEDFHITAKVGFCHTLTRSNTHVNVQFLCIQPSPVFQQTKERVKLLIQLADGFCEKGHSHAGEIKKWVTAVDKRYRDFSLRMDKYRCSLEKALGISSDSNKAVSTQLHNIYSLHLVYFFFTLPLPLQSKDLQLDIIPATAPGSEVKLRDAAHELNEEKRKSARRKEYAFTSLTL